MSDPHPAPVGGRPEGEPSGVRSSTLVRRLRTDGQTTPEHVDSHTPALSWTVAASGLANTQARYRVLVAAVRDQLHPGGELTWDSGWVATAGVNGLVYAGPRLEPLRRYHWTVRVDDAAGNASDWASPAWFETGLLRDGAWEAPWISAPFHEVDEEGRGSVTYLRASFVVGENPSRVIACFSALGIYRAYCNGRRISRDELEPGWTDYTKRVLYQKHDVTELIVPGENTLEIVLADGWWAGHVGWFGRDLYGGPAAASAELSIEDEHGRRPLTIDEAAWSARRGLVVASDLLMGEVQDLSAYTPGQTGADEGARWSPAVRVDPPGARIEARTMEPVRVHARCPAVTVTTLRRGVQLVDFGRHLAGRASVRVTGEPGTRVAVRHGEALDERGELYTDNLRSASQENVFVLAGGGEELLEPEFTIQGFRFAEIRGELAPIDPADAEALVLQSDLPRLGSFHASDPLLDKLQENVVWSQRGNFVSVPTDCPQRDERLGWTGDIHLFADTAAFNLDCRRFLGTWVRSLADGQAEDGRVYDIAPYPPIDPRPEGIQIAQPGWGDAIIGVPWSLYLHHGDARILSEHWDAMRRWMASGAGGDGLIRSAGAYEDWNSLGPKTPTELIGTYWYARAARNMAQIARVLGEDPGEFEELHAAVRHAFREEFLTTDHTLVAETQTGYAIALDGDLVTEDGRAVAADRLVELLRDRDWRVTTGFIGTAALLPALTRAGHVDVAYRLATQTAYPSWGHHVLNDATTMWEHWDTWLPGERFQDPKMNSFNHFALATIGGWFYRFVAGINPDPERPGYYGVNITPHPGPTLVHARAHVDTSAGTVQSSWWRDRETIRFSVTLPAHATGRFQLPWLSDPTLLSSSGQAGQVTGGGEHPVSAELGPGSSSFSVPTATTHTSSRPAGHRS